MKRAKKYFWKSIKNKKGFPFKKGKSHHKKNSNPRLMNNAPLAPR